MFESQRIHLIKSKKKNPLNFANSIASDLIRQLD